MYARAISDARCVFDMAVSKVQLYLLVLSCVLVTRFISIFLLQEEIGFSMKILDIGCGFSGSENQLELVSASCDSTSLRSSL